MTEPRVVIVGAGPAGLVLAWRLHRERVPFLLVERQTRDEIGRLPKAGILEHRTVELLAREGLTDEVLDVSVTNGRTEFRSPEAAVVLDYGAMTGDRPHRVLPQHRFVEQVSGALVADDAPLRFSHRVTGVGTDGERPWVTVTGPDGTTTELTPDVVVGADGAGSAVARALAGHVETHDRTVPARWLVISAASPPIVGHTIYGIHPRGFAAHLRRGPTETRFYLEVDPDHAAPDPDDPAMRADLADRLGLGDALSGLPISGVDSLDLRTRVVAPMQYGGLVLVGDAAHLITPAGGKGMNLAVQDAVELADGLVAAYGPHDDGPGRLAAYSQTRLPTIWRTQAFSDWFLRILTARTAEAVAGDGPAAFVAGMRAGWVRSLRDDPLLARWFAHAYAGVDPGT